jgi:hypothetical protein
MSDQTFTVTRIQFFDESFQQQISEFECELVAEYSANVFINDEFVIQVSGNGDEARKPTFAPSDACYATTEAAQEAASEKYDMDDIIEQIESEGFENNWDYLSENANETY